MRAFHYLSVIKAKNSLEDALQYSYRAVEYANKYPELTRSMDLLRMQGELLISKWLSGFSMSDIYIDLDSSLKMLLEHKRNDIFWKSLFLTFTHCTSFFMSIAKTGSPPEFNDAGDPFAPLTRGFFMSGNEELKSEYFDSADFKSKYAYFYSIVSSFARYSNNYGKGLYWADKALELARSRTPQVFITLENSCPIYLESKQYEKVIELSIGVSQIMNTIKSVSEKMDAMLAKREDFDEALSSLSEDERKSLEFNASYPSVLTIYFRILKSSLDSKDLAKQDILLLSESCETVSRESFTPEHWLNISKVLTLIVDDSKEPADVTKYINSTEKHMLLYHLYNLGLVFKRNVNMESMLAAQAYAVAKTLPYIYIGREIFVENVLSYIFPYWENAVRNQKFQFSTPYLVEESFAVISKDNSEQKIKEIFRAIHLGLNVRLHSDVLAWMND